MDIWDSLCYFKAHEFNAPDEMDHMLLRMLDRMRALADMPFHITSSYRHGDDGAHGSGHAVDIRCPNSRSRMRLAWAAHDAGFRRVGIYDKHVHVDNDPDEDQDVLWIGESQ